MTVRGSHRRCLVRAVGGACLAFVFLAAAESDAAETRGYVISMVHTATYADTDHCPMGGNGGPVELRTRRLIGAGYSESEAREIMLNGGRDTEGNRVEAMQLFGSFGGQGWGGLEVNPGTPRICYRTHTSKRRRAGSRLGSISTAGLTPMTSKIRRPTRGVSTTGRGRLSAASRPSMSESLYGRTTRTSPGCAPRRLARVGWACSVWAGVCESEYTRAGTLDFAGSFLDALKCQPPRSCHGANKPEPEVPR